MPPDFVGGVERIHGCYGRRVGRCQRPERAHRCINDLRVAASDVRRASAEARARSGLVRRWDRDAGEQEAEGISQVAFRGLAGLGGLFVTEEGVVVLLLELLDELIDAEDGPDPGRCTRTLTFPLTHGCFGFGLHGLDATGLAGVQRPEPSLALGGHRREERSVHLG